MKQFLCLVCTLLFSVTFYLPLMVIASKAKEDAAMLSNYAIILRRMDNCSDCMQKKHEITAEAVYAHMSSLCLLLDEIGVP